MQDNSQTNINVMKHVFIIQAHTNSEQIFRLVRSLDANNHYFIVHIDLKSTHLLDEPMMNQLSHKSNVKIISRYKINWGGANQFFASLDCIKEALHKWPDLMFFHLLSGQDYPIKTNEEIDEVFRRDSESNYIALGSDYKMNRRLDVYFFRDLLDIRNCSKIVKGLDMMIEWIQLSLLSIGIRFRKNLNLKIYKGSNWWSLNREAINYILDYIMQNPKIISRFKYTNCCDEIFFHTILYNSPISHTLVNNNLRYIDWENRGNSVPNVLDETDFDVIKESGKLFCRKIVSPKSDTLVSLLDYNKTQSFDGPLSN